jgi:hypothetical protein
VQRPERDRLRGRRRAPGSRSQRGDRRAGGARWWVPSQPMCPRRAARSLGQWRRPGRAVHGPGDRPGRATTHMCLPVTTSNGLDVGRRTSGAPGSQRPQPRRSGLVDDRPRHGGCAGFAVEHRPSAPRRIERERPRGPAVITEAAGSTAGGPERTGRIGRRPAARGTVSWQHSADVVHIGPLSGS